MMAQRSGFAALLVVLHLGASPALALSELKEEGISPPPDVQVVPLPPPLPNPANQPAAQPVIEPQDEGVEEPAETPGDGETKKEAAPGDADIPVPAISYDIGALPEPVRKTREELLEATRSGNLQALRPFIRTEGENATELSLGGVEGDPIEHLKQMSGDGEGQEILAILQEVLEAGYVHTEIGTENEIYLWPYFFAVPLDTLDARQRVELFRLVTAGDYEDMKNFGAYIFYRTGIRPDGSWAFFVAGD
ncbi:MAG TPA: hypothetical protein VNS02_03190 [Rhizobiaceae bacterium]|nr:hypothetical protein [Rhizobiaceae bacterium]